MGIAEDEVAVAIGDDVAAAQGFDIQTETVVVAKSGLAATFELCCVTGGKVSTALCSQWVVVDDAVSVNVAHKA